MKKVFLNAYTELNLGDDLFIENILERYSRSRFFMLSNNKYETYFNKQGNLKTINENNWIFTQLKKVWQSGFARYLDLIKRRCIANIYIGGSIFIEYPSWKQVLNWWNYQVDNYPFYVLGANFGPFHDEEYRNSMNDVFSRMKDICFRDYNSYGLFNENDKVRYAPDILFSQKIEKQKVTKKIFVSLIDCDSKDEGSNKLDNLSNNYYLSISNVLKKYIKDDYEIVLVAFCEKEGDCKANNTILEMLEYKSNVRLITYDGYNRKEILNELSSSLYVIGTRFHSIVLAMVANKPFFPIVYSKKTLNMLNDLDYKGNLIDIKEIEKIDFDYVNENLKNNYILDIEDYRKEAEKHYLYLDKVLKD